MFNLIEEVTVKHLSIDKHIGRIAANDVIDTATGEIYASKDAELTEEIIESIKGSGVSKVQLLSIETTFEQDLIINTLKKIHQLIKKKPICNLQTTAFG